MRLVILLCIMAAGAPVLASAQFYCMTGIPCGNGCTMGDGLCINGRCFDRTGRLEWECMAPMRGPTPLRLQGRDTPQFAPTSASKQPPQQQNEDPDFWRQPLQTVRPAEWKAQVWMPRAPTWQPWSFHPFPSFTFWKPWAAPFTPFGPVAMFNDCGGKGPCGKGQFCDAEGVCRQDDCESQFKYGCPGDKGQLKKVGCPHFSGFKECFTSTSEGFRCFKGPSGASISCATQAGNMGGAVWTSSSGFQGPTSFGWDDEAEMQEEDEEDAPRAAPATTTATATAKVPTAPASGAGAATATPPAATAPTAPSTATAATAKPQAAAAAAGSSASSTDGNSRQSAFKKVVVEAGPAQAAGAAGASAAASTAATGEPRKSLVGGKPNLLVQSDQQLPPGARVGPMFGPDGSTMMAAGPGPSLGMVDVDPAGRGVAAGMASGDQKTVVTRRGPNGMSTMSSSVSNGGPAFASSVSGR